MRRRGSGIAYLIGITIASLSTALWLGTVGWKYRKHLEDPDFEIETKLVILLVVKAVFLGIHGPMVRVDWSAWGFAYYFAFAILFFDMLQVIVAAALWKQLRSHRRNMMANKRKECKNHRKEYLESLPRMAWQEVQPRTSDEEAPVPDESKANPSKEQSCIFCLAEFTDTDTVVKLDCGHIFHESCISNWILDEKRDPCPFRCTNFPEHMAARTRDTGLQLQSMSSSERSTSEAPVFNTTAAQQPAIVGRRATG